MEGATLCQVTCIDYAEEAGVACKYMKIYSNNAYQVVVNAWNSMDNVILFNTGAKEVFIDCVSAKAHVSACQVFQVVNDVKSSWLQLRAYVLLFHVCTRKYNRLLNKYRARVPSIFMF